MGSSRTLTSAMIVISIILLFHFAGFFSDPNIDCSLSTEFTTPTTYILREMGLTCPQNLGDTDLYATVLLLTSIFSIGAITIGTLTTKSFEYGLFVGAGIPLVYILFMLSWDMIYIFMELKEINIMFAVMIISPFLFGIFFSLFDWVRGRD